MSSPSPSEHGETPERREDPPLQLANQVAPRISLTPRDLISLQAMRTAQFPLPGQPTSPRSVSSRSHHSNGVPSVNVPPSSPHQPPTPSSIPSSFQIRNLPVTEQHGVRWIYETFILNDHSLSALPLSKLQAWFIEILECMNFVDMHSIGNQPPHFFIFNLGMHTIQKHREALIGLIIIFKVDQPLYYIK